MTSPGNEIVPVRPPNSVIIVPKFMLLSTAPFYISRHDLFFSLCSSCQKDISVSF